MKYFSILNSSFQENDKTKVYASKDSLGVCKLINYKSSVKPVLNGYTKIDKTQVLKTNGSLMNVLEQSEILLTCIKQ